MTTDHLPRTKTSTRVSTSFPSLDVITGLALPIDGPRLVFTQSALYTLSPCGLPTLLAGHRTERGFKDSQGRRSGTGRGFTDGQGSAARFYCPQGITVDGAGNVLVADTFNHALRKVARNGAVSTLAGNGEAGYADGEGSAARFNQPWGITVDADGIIYVTDSGNNCVRQVGPDDVSVSTLAGDGIEGSGFANGLGLNARFDTPSGLALDTDGHLIVADMGNNCIRRVTTAEGCVTTVAGSAEHDRGFADGEGAAARFNGPLDITVDGHNNILVADTKNNRIRMIAGSAACVTTVAGSAEPGNVDGKNAAASFHEPRTLAIDARGWLFVADRNPGCVRMVDASLEPPRQLLASRVLHLQVRTQARCTQSCICCR